MAGASKGLQSALARSASGAVIALAELSVEDLLSTLSDDLKAGLGAQLAAAGTVPAAVAGKAADKTGDEPDEDDKPEGQSGSEKKCETCGEVKKDGKCDCELGAKGGSDASERARVKAVATAVETDDNCKGKASLALSMLADDDFAGLSGAAMVKLLGKTPAEGSSAAAAGSDPVAAARAEMKAAIAETGNSSVDASAAGKNASKASTESIWDQAQASIGLTKR